MMRGVLRNTWYVAAKSRELGARPVGRKLFGVPMVLFRDAAGSARAIGAECPHRSADLSMGRVVDGHVQCPYHGWRFDGRGTCVLIPSQSKGEPIPARAKVPSRPVVEVQGNVWIWYGDGPPTSPAPTFDFWGQHPRSERLFNDPVVIPGSFVEVLEQAVDTTHAPYIHGGTLGSNYLVEYARADVKEDADGRGLGWKEPRKSFGKSQLYQRLLRKVIGELASREVRAIVSGMVYNRTDYTNGGWDIMLFQLTPADVHETWLFGETVATHNNHVLGRLARRRFLRRLIEEDRVIMAGLHNHLTGESLPPLSAEGDYEGLVARKLFRRLLREQEEATFDRDTR